MKIVHDPIAQFMQEHDEALERLKILNKAVSAVSQNGYSYGNFRQIAGALKFIEKEVRDHNRKEERALFPALEQHVAGPTRILRNEHKKLRAKYIRLKKAADRLNNNRDSFSAIKKLAGESKETVQLLVNHIHKENHILFPLVRKFISKDKMREIAKKML
jgi:hemerythrin-like domain-containing protein